MPHCGLTVLPERHIGGWLRAIRQALGISSAGVATRLGITASGLRKLEQDEASDGVVRFDQGGQHRLGHDSIHLSEKLNFSRLVRFSAVVSS